MALFSPPIQGGILKPPTLVERPNFAHPQLDGCVAWWPILSGAGRIASDLIGNHDASFTGSPSWVTASVGQAIQFDGSSAYLACGDLSGFFTDEATLSMWIRCASQTPGTGAAGLVSGPEDDNANRTLYGNAGSKVYFAVFATSRIINNKVNTFDRTEWHLLTITTRPGTNNYQFWQNGLLQETGTGPGSIASVDAFKIGFDFNAYLDGEVADVRLYAKASTEAEIIDRWQSPWAPFARRVWIPVSTGGGYTLTPVASVTGNVSPDVAISDAYTLTPVDSTTGNVSPDATISSVYTLTPEDSITANLSELVALAFAYTLTPVASITANISPDVVISLYVPSTPTDPSLAAGQHHSPIIGIIRLPNIGITLGLN